MRAITPTEEDVLRQAIALDDDESYQRHIASSLHNEGTALEAIIHHGLDNYENKVRNLKCLLSEI